MHEILPNGSFTKKQGHYKDNGLSQALIALLKDRRVMSVVDFGCGDAGYARDIRDATGIWVEAYDGNPNTEEMTNGFARQLDLSIPFQLDSMRMFNAVISLEVGEHIPPQFEQVYIDNLVRHAAELIIISWAIPKQHGEGHVNCRSNEYIIEEFKKRNWSYDQEASQKLRASITSCHWFRNTLMVFC